MPKNNCIPRRTIPFLPSLIGRRGSLLLWFAFLLLSNIAALGQSNIIMPRNGIDTVYLNSNNMYTVYDPGGTGNYYNLDNSTLVLISSDGRPFSLSGNYHITGGHCLAIYQGPSKAYPLENFFTDTTGYIEVYCYNGAATLHFTTSFGRQEGFELSVCFPQIYNVHAYNTNSTYSNISWTDNRNYYWYYNSWYVDYYQSNDPSQNITEHITYQNSDSLNTLASGTEYTYFVGNQYYEYGTSNICATPPHKLRTPKVQDCNSCDHYRECIDYTDFNNASQVTCFKGNTNHPDSAVCVVNEGAESPLSRHTINTDTTMFDSRTANLLPTIPQGDTASVRLGNWTAGGNGESILYEIHVDTNDYDLLMLRYAVVFQYSSGVGGGLPRFTIRLFDQNCLPVNPLCYCRDYVCDSSATGWHVTSTNNSSAPYVWHDWTAMSIDIAQYHGKTLYLQLSTRDGSGSGAAYAYFTLHCSRKQIDHLEQCRNNVANTFYAPEGFSYRWYKASNPNVTLSTTNSLHVTTAGLYQCRVNNLDCGTADCGYTINALASPRYALANFDDSSVAANCRFSVRLTNRSVVTDSINPLWTREDCETAFWDFGDGRTSTNYNTEVVYTNPGTYNITLISTIAGGECADTMTRQITLNWQYPRASITGPTRVCPGTDVELQVHHTISRTWHLWGFPHTYPTLPLEELDQSINVTCDVTDSNQCTYTLEHAVNVLPAFNYSASESRCEAQLPFTWRDTTFETYTETGNYVFHRQTVNGCDSIVTLHLNILPTYTFSRTVNICDYTSGWRYFSNVHGTTIDTMLTTLGENTIVHHLPSGCDSIVYVTLNQLPAPRDTIFAQRCQGISFDSADFSFTAEQTMDPGLLSSTRRIANTPCDSFATLKLTVLPHTDTTISLTITQNELPFIVGDDTINHSVSNYVSHLTNHWGCDSTVHLTLNVNMNVSTTQSRTICSDLLPYTWDGLVFDSAGRQQLVFTLANGADSIDYHVLHVNPTYDIHDTAIICQDALPYIWHDTTITSVPVGQTVIFRHLTSSSLCDSNMTLHLTVMPTFATTITDTTCNTSLPYLFADSAIICSTGTSSHSFHLSTANGCDSLVTLQLTVNAATTSTFRDTVVENQLPYTFNGSTITADDFNASLTNPLSGFSTFDTLITITNSAGCDSNIHLFLSAFWNGRTTVDSTICANMLPLTWDGTLFDTTLISQSSVNNSQFTISDTLTGQSGADSIVIRTLHLLPVYSITVYETICNNQIPYNWNGTIITDAVDGTSNIDFELLTQDGCDSLVTLQLTVNEVTDSIVFDTIVENQLPYTFNGTTITASDFDSNSCCFGTTVTITNTANCDSIIDLRLTVHWNVYNTVDSTICPSWLPLTWNGLTFISADTLNVTLTSYTGADSILTMQLSLYNTYSNETRDTICSNQLPFLWQDSLIDNAIIGTSTYQRQFASIELCDSVETLLLTVHSTSQSTIGDTIVENQLPYTFNGTTIAATDFDSLLRSPVSVFSSIDSTITIVNAIGCDSTIHYSLNVHWNRFASADSSVCQNDLPFSWNEVLFDTTDMTPANQTGSHYVISKQALLTAHTGADSLLTMNLTVNINSDSTLFDTIVENQLPYTFNGATYTFSLFDTAGFDANPEVRFQTSSLDSLLIIGNNAGCDSLILHRLTVRWNKVTHLDSSVCQNMLPMEWQGVTFDNILPQAVEEPSQTRLTDTVVYNGIYGEDSLVVLHLTVLHNTLSSLTDTVVQNQLPYTWNAVSFDIDNIDSVVSSQPDSLTSIDLQQGTILVNNAGCDSMTTMNLTVWLNRTATADSSVCENFIPFVWNETIFDTFMPPTLTEQHTVLLLTTHGADSLLTMNVTKLLNSFSTITDTIAERQLPYDFNGYIFTDSLFTDTVPYPNPEAIYRLSWLDTTVLITNTNGCDSIITYRLYVHWNVHSSTDSTICQDILPLTWNSVVFDTSDFQSQETGIHYLTKYDTLVAWNSADSIIGMNLRVNPTYLTNFHDTVCEDQTFVWYDDTLTVTGIYERHYTTVDGCDSSEYLHFANYPNYDLVYYDTICDYSGIMRMGVEYIGVAHLTTIHLCDSNETYHLWGLPVSYSNIDTIICDSRLPFDYHGYTFEDTTGGQLQLVLTNQYGCDSIVNFTLTVLPTLYTTVDSTICEDMLPMTWDGTLFDTIPDTQTLTHNTLITIVDTFVVAYGVDSIVTRNLYVNPTYDIGYIDTTCNGAPYSFGDSAYNVTGIYTHLYQTIDGCDSIETLLLQVNAMSYATQSDTIVQNQLPYTFGGVTFTSLSGVTDTIITILNTVACDSVITYSLTVLPNTYVTKDTTLCDNLLPLTWDGLTFTPLSTGAGAYTLEDSTIVLLSDGTDSVTRYHVNVNRTYNLTDTVRICDIYTWIDGNSYTESTTIDNYLLQSQEGCDSILNLILTIDHSFTTTDSITSCDPLTWIDGFTYYQSIGGVSHLLQTIHGCDSLVYLQFTKVEHKSTHLYDTICNGVRYPFGGNEYTQTGDYDDTLRTVMGCDSVVTLHLNVLMPFPIVIDSSHDCDYRTYSLTVNTDAPYIMWTSIPEDPTLTGQEQQRTITVKPRTHETYLLFADYKDVPTCPNSLSVNLSPLLKPHAEIAYSPEFLTLDQPQLQLHSRSTNEQTLHWWINGDDYGDFRHLTYVADATLMPADVDSVTVMLTATNEPCHDTAVVIIPFRKAAIWAPNTFTPGESNNNLFFIRYIGITDYSIDLYTRGGALVWHSEDMNDTWDGTFGGKPCPQGTYVWIIRYRDITNPRNQLSKRGTVTLLR